MSKKDFLYFCLTSIFAGIMIGLGGTASLISNILSAEIGKIIGAVLFSLGIYVIIIFEMKLFTGMASDIPTMGAKNWWQLLVCFVGNAIGVILVGVLVEYSPLSYVSTLGAEIINGKLMSDNWAIYALCSSILCGALITLSVKSSEKAKEKHLSATLAIIFPIVVFAFCGFDHSVANMLYFFHFGEFSLQIVGYVIITMIGNVLGGVALPLVLRLKKK